MCTVWSCPSQLLRRSTQLAFFKHEPGLRLPRVGEQEEVWRNQDREGAAAEHFHMPLNSSLTCNSPSRKSSRDVVMREKSTTPRTRCSPTKDNLR